MLLVAVAGAGIAVAISWGLWTRRAWARVAAAALWAAVIPGEVWLWPAGGLHRGSSGSGWCAVALLPPAAGIVLVAVPWGPVMRWVWFALGLTPVLWILHGAEVL